VIRALIVDDEPLAREGLRLWLGHEPDLEVIGEAGDGESAVSAIVALRPDLVFLDVQMPGLDGFGVLGRVASEHLPAVVFVTSHDRHAVRAFDVHALDYVLKPVRAERLAEAVRRARADLARGEDRAAPERLGALLDALDPAPRAGSPPCALRRFVVRGPSGFSIVRVEDVRWVRSAGNYAELHTARGTHLVRGTMDALERQLDADRFARIHRTIIVGLDEVREVTPTPHGDYTVRLADGATVPMSRTYRGRLGADR